MKLVKLLQKRMFLKPHNVVRSAETGGTIVVLVDTSQPETTDLRIDLGIRTDLSHQGETYSNLIPILEEALSKYYGAPLRDFKTTVHPTYITFNFCVEEVQVEHTDFMHTYEKSVTTSALIEIQIDELEGENGDNKFQFEGQVFDPKDLVKYLQGYPTSDVTQLLYAANISHKQYSPIELAQEINNGSDNFSNSYVISTVTIEVQSGTK
ncbi:MAG: hypothetical protein RR280_01045 [Bacteroidaceae bacterium]